MSIPREAIIELNEAERDVHSYAEPEKFRVHHIDLELQVLFDSRIVRGVATLTIQRSLGSQSPLVLDTRDLIIENVESLGEHDSWRPAAYNFGERDSILGTPLIIDVPQGASQVRIFYCTSPHASGLQWLNPAQTGDRNSPFLFTQSQEIHARSWIPLQDTPAVRFTYNAHVKTPRELVALMGATNDPDAPRNGKYDFRMDRPIPSYLLALAVGDISFAPTGRRSGVYAEASLLSAAAREFSDTEKMLSAAEKLYGSYRWGRYDLLVLPPSFPFGGMENPRLTYVSPTLITGDKGLVALVAHELAHSWAGNLVTNATWSDFWLNEGFTTYIERRILEAVYGSSFARMEDVLGRQKLDEELTRLTERDQILHIDLRGRDPDDGATEVPYEKAALLLKSLEEVFGRDALDEYLRKYFDSFAFQSITTNQAVEFLKENLVCRTDRSRANVDLEEWIYKPGIPVSAPQLFSERLHHAEQEAKRWYSAKINAHQIDAAAWSTHEWRRFLGVLPMDLNKARMGELDREFRLTQSQNVEIIDRWLRMAARNQYEPAYSRIEEFVLTVGRKRYLKPLYEELLKVPDCKQWAKNMYAKARPSYHPITQAALDRVFTAK
jgi:leukotriene-A4 hydrolase